jgi:hypothetical protein
MMVTTLHQVEDTLRQIDPDTLREMVCKLAQSHTTVCELTSQIGGCAHIGSEEIRDRVDRLSVAELAARLAPTAWLSVDLHRRIGA